MFNRRHRLGHAKQMAYVVERPQRQAARAQALLFNKPPREVPPSPPPPPLNLWQKWFGKQPDVFTFGLNKFVETPANDNRSPFADGYAFCERLKKKGWKKLGSGAHSQVLAKGDSDKVIKVGCSGDNWMRYVLWGRKHGYEGNFVPKVYSYKYFRGADRSPFYVAIVERMERCTSKGRAYTDERVKDPILLDLFQYAARKNEHATAALNFLQPGCGDFCQKLTQAANDNNWAMDIHGGNFMVRKNGSWVATDPINAHGDTPTERIRSRAA